MICNMVDEGMMSEPQAECMGLIVYMFVVCNETRQDVVFDYNMGDRRVIWKRNAWNDDIHLIYMYLSCVLCIACYHSCLLLSWPFGSIGLILIAYTCTSISVILFCFG